LKPIDLKEFKIMLPRAAFLHEVEPESTASLEAQERSIKFEQILGKTPTMREIFSVIQRVARTDATVLMLFGHERGAFTGAHTQRRGKFEVSRPTPCTASSTGTPSGRRTFASG
jgi:DNA-binding NtrC family response regulator